MARSLLADVVYESLAADLVVRLEDIVDLADRVLIVAHVDGLPLNISERHHRAPGVVMS